MAFSFTNPFGSFSNPFGQQKPTWGNKIDFSQPQDDPNPPQDQVFNRTVPFTQQEPQKRKSFADYYNDVSSAPAGPAQQKYKDFLAQGGPDEADYKPGKIRRLGAILSGAAAGFRNPGSGYDVADNIISKPFNDATQSWNQDAARLREGANSENSDMGKRIGLAKDLADNDQKQRSLEEATRLHDANINNINSQIKDREDAARFRGLTIIKGDDGHIYSVNKDGTDKKDLGKYNESKPESRAGATQQAIDTARGVAPIHEGSAIRVGAANAQSQANAHIFSADKIFNNERGPKLEDAKDLAGFKNDLKPVKSPTVAQNKDNLYAKLSEDPSLRRFIDDNGELQDPETAAGKKWFSSFRAGATPADWADYGKAYEARFGKPFTGGPKTSATPSNVASPKPKIQRNF